MDALQNALAHARRWAPQSLDFDAMEADYARQVAKASAQWRGEHPDLDAAVLRMTLNASGHTKKRLRRYREIDGFDGSAPGLLTRQEATSLKFVHHRLVIVAAAAARADINSIEWSLITVAEALAPPP